jgi:hypothetical protein
VGRWTRWEPPLGALSVFACALALRIPFGSSYLWAWDSVLYARAMEHFAVDLGRPHPPGYLFYVLTARLASWWLGDANAALVLVSVLSGALTCAAGYVIGRRFLGTAGGVLVAVMLLTNPLLWQYSEVAYPYATLALLGGTLGALLWAARRGPPAMAIGASLALGLATGFRQDLFLLGPLWLYVVTRRGWRTIAVATVAGAVGCLAWLIPTAGASGGLATYLDLVRTQFVSVSTVGDPTVATVAQNAERTLLGLRAQVTWTWPLLIAGGWVAIRRRSVPVMLVGLWVGPPLALYVFGHIGEWAYTLFIAIPLAIAAAIGAQHLLAANRGLRRTLVAAALVLVLALNGRSFVMGGLKEIARHDLILAEQVTYIRTHFAPGETLVVAQGNYQHVAQYLPEYPAVYMPQSRGAVRLAAARAGARWVVLFGDEGHIREQARVVRVTLPNDVRLRVVHLRSGERLLADAQVLSVIGD